MKTPHRFSNASIIFITQPLWTIPAAVFTLYASLYMRALGLSAVQIGWANSILVAFTVVGAGLGGILADRWGRKRTLMVVDSVVWFSFPLLSAVAQNFWYFAAVSVICGLGLLVLPAWECLYIEDEEPDRRARRYAILQFVLLCSGVVAPVGGYLVQTYSIVPAMRGIYVFTILSVSTGLLIRLFLVRETSVGERLHQAGRAASESLVAQHRRALSFLARHRDLGVLSSMQALVQFSWSLWTPFAPQYFTDDAGLGIDVRTISFVPVVSSAVMGIVLLWVIPRVSYRSHRKVMIAGAGASAVGVLSLTVSPGNSVALLLAFSSVWALGIAMFGPIRQTAWANLAPDAARASLLSTTATLSYAFAAPAGALGGWLYTLNTRAPFALLFLVYLALAGFGVRLSREGNERKGVGQGSDRMCVDPGLREKRIADLSERAERRRHHGLTGKDREDFERRVAGQGRGIRTFLGHRS